MLLILLTYLAGVLTILSPCILPVLPFVFSRAQGSFLKSSLPLLLGMGLTFSLLSAIAIVGGEWIAQANEWGRVFAMILLGVFGLSLIFPQVSEKMVAPLTRLGGRLGSGPSKDGLLASIMIGVSTGLLWAPCAGPILGLVLTGAASQGSVAKSVGLLISYSLGAMTSLSIALVAGNRFLGQLKKFLGVDRVIKRGLGIAVLLGVVAIFFNLDRTVLTRLSKFETASIENKLLAIAEPATNSHTVSQDEGPMPELVGADKWLNSLPLTRESLKGKVVLIDFWTYSCINCLRTLPYVKTWAQKYRSAGLVVIGIHSPEFAFEKSEANVQKALTDLGIPYPVALDNHYAIWNAFKNMYWPAHYFVDRQGNIRHHHFGEGEYAESEKVIQDLLRENGQTILTEMTAVVPSGIQAPPAEEGAQSPETYLGYARAENAMVFPALQKDRSVLYTHVKNLMLNQWSVEGNWKIEKERAILQKRGGKISFRFLARDVHLVLGSKNAVPFKVTLDGHAPQNNHGVDIDPDGTGVINEQRLYQLIRQDSANENAEHLFEIEFFSSDAEAYAFTFG